MSHQLASKSEPFVKKSGNTIIRIHSDLAWMSEEEQRDWYKSEWEKGNPVLLRIAKVLFSD